MLLVVQFQVILREFYGTPSEADRTKTETEPEEVNTLRQ